MELKRLLNHSEEVTDRRLRDACDPHDVRVFAKVRLADILPIDGSGIPTREYAFALKAHVDFLVVAADLAPLFAVEFDGPQHRDATQVARDETKNDLCRHFGLPLLRVDDRFLDRRYMNMDLLGWLVGVVLTRRRDRELVQAGELSPEDAAAADPIFCAPFVISYEARQRLSALSETGMCDRYPPFFIGVDEQDNAYAIAGLHFASGQWLYITAEMPYQRFFLLAENLLEEIIYIKLADAAEAVIAGKRQLAPPAEFAHRVGTYLEKYQTRHAFLINPRAREIGRLG
jgi:hypothetical protein